MVKLDVGISYFITSELQILELSRTLKSIYDHVSNIYLIDGRYTEFKHKLDYSIPTCNEVIKTWYPKVQIRKIQDIQLVKRQAYLDANDADYLLVMDADDFIHPDHQNWDLFYKELEDVYNEPELLYFLWFWVDPINWECSANPVTKGTWQKYVRIHKRPNEQKYHLNHYTWRMKDNYKVDLTSLPCKKTLGGIKLTCDSVYRDKDFLKRKADWEQADCLKEQARAWVAFNKLNQLYHVVFPKTQKQ